MKVGLVVNRVRSNALEFADRLSAEGLGHGIETELLDPDEPEQVELVVAVGGDGTVLEATRAALRLDVPLLGFNLGTVGFLTEAEPGELGQALTRLAGGDYRVEERMTLRAVVDGRPDTCSDGVNDVVIEKIDSQRLVVLDMEIDGEQFLSYRSDGVVIATSTGSTAYAFSAGGPLVDPILDTLLVTPVAPHSLFNRTLVLSGSSVIRARVAADRPVRVSIDGREVAQVQQGGAVEVIRGARTARFVRFDEETFPSKVTRKFELR